MNTQNFVSPSVALAVLIFAIGGCATPPQPQHTPPQPQHTPPPPPSKAPPPPQSNPPSESQSSAGVGAEQKPSDSATPAQPSEATAAAEQKSPPAGDLEQSNGPPPSNAAADVEITDIPVDANGDPIIDKTRPEATQNSAAQQRTASTSAPGQRPSGGGSPVPAGATAGSRRAAAAAPGGAQTEAERVAALEQDLDGRLAKFDELMRKAREDAEKERATSGYSSYGSASGGEGSRQTPPSNGDGAGGQADSSSGLGHTPDQTGSTRPGEYHSAESSADGNIPSARDDDIVARQLREAATREADPVLREKLWDEYRKYKKGIGR